MNNKFRIILCALLVLFVVCLCSCDTVISDETTTDYSQDEVPFSSAPEAVEEHDYFTIINNGDLTYTYEIRDVNGNMLLYESQCKREPHIEMLSDNLLKCMISFGTGIGAQSTFYVNVESGDISEVFNAVYDEHDGKTVYHAFINSKHYMIVQDIFDKEAYCKELEIDGAFYSAQPVIRAEFSEDASSLDIVCLVGEDYVETQMNINIK